MIAAIRQRNERGAMYVFASDGRLMRSVMPRMRAGEMLRRGVARRVGPNAIQLIRPVPERDAAGMEPAGWTPRWAIDLSQLEQRLTGRHATEMIDALRRWYLQGQGALDPDADDLHEAVGTYVADTTPPSQAARLSGRARVVVLDTAGQRLPRRATGTFAAKLVARGYARWVRPDRMIQLTAAADGADDSDVRTMLAALRRRPQLPERYRHLAHRPRRLRTVHLRTSVSAGDHLRRYRQTLGVDAALQQRSPAAAMRRAESRDSMLP